VACLDLKGHKTPSNQEGVRRHAKENVKNDLVSEGILRRGRGKEFSNRLIDKNAAGTECPSRLEAEEREGARYSTRVSRVPETVRDREELC